MRRSKSAAAWGLYCALALGLPGVGSGAAVAQQLNLAVAAPVTSIDPHYHQLSPNNAVRDMIFDSLVHTDAQARLHPGLAAEWHAIDPLTWEFRLRPGVRFHNGRELTAEDVAFTFARVPNVPNAPTSFTIFVRPIIRFEILDPLTFRLHTATPWPLLPSDVAQIAILDRETHERAATEDFNAGRAAAGTGPYRMLAYRSGDRIEFERNDAWWGPRQPWQRVTYRMITNDAARTAALLAGDVDFIDQVPSTDLARLRTDARLSISEIIGLRLIYLALDQSRTEATPFIADNDGRPIPRNPLRDPRVRRALSLLIDRQAIAERVMEGAATPAGQFLPPGSFGAVPELAAPRADVETARRLLAEAGFPQGFRITLHGPNDRYPNDARIIQAIGGMWTRAGVRTTIEAQTWTTFIGRASRQEYSAMLVGWGSSSGEASNPLRNLAATWDASRGFGASNRGRYSNPAVDALIDRAMAEIDDPRREALMQEATRIVFGETGLIPLHIQINLWAMKRGLAHDARADELTRAQDIRPAAGAATR